MHVYRNIMATFLASALLLHTGYLGSPWLGLNPFQLRDWLVYFAAQGGLVCLTYWWVNRAFWAHLPTVARWGIGGGGLGIHSGQQCVVARAAVGGG